MITVRAPTGDKAAAAVTVRTPTGDKAVATMTLRTPTGDKEIYSAGGGAGMLTVSASPVSATGSGSSAGDIDVTTNEVTATASGGTAPYTFAWTAPGGLGSWTILSPASASTRFRANNVPGNALENNTFECTATDSRGRTGSVLVSADAYNFGGF